MSAKDAAKTLNDIHDKLFPEGQLVGEVVKALDLFYSDP
jgi:hypothetical protein